MSAGFRLDLLASIRRLFTATAGSGPSDAELLRRFAQSHDEAAFELLVWRHAALVFNVCRQLIRDEQMIEDAFQATFLVLVRKAGTIRHHEALAGWLHRVSFRIALRAREHLGNQTRAESTGVDLEQLPAQSSSMGIEEDLRQVVHEEVLRLPTKYRLPIVSCYLEAKTHEEAALELGWSKGTVAGRLARAKELLQRRLVRRGVTLSVTTLAAELSVGMASAACWSRRITLLLQGLREMATNESTASGLLSPGAIALAEGVFTTMFWTKMKWIAVVALFVGITGVTAGFWTARPGGTRATETATERQPGDEETGRVERKPARAEDPLPEAAHRALVRRNLRLLALAMHNYHDMMGHFPAPAITDKAGKPLLSWRVALLPFLEEDGDRLYKEFRLNEPWDSPHNKKLLARMPRVFAPVSAKPRRPHSTFFQLLVGPGAMFTAYSWPAIPGGGGTPAGAGEGAVGLPGTDIPGGSRPGTGPGGLPGGSPGSMSPGMPGSGGRMMMPGGSGMGADGMSSGPPRMMHIFDGTANTIMLVEAGDLVPWTKPEDVAYHAKKPLPKLGGQFANVIHVAMGDGSVRSLPRGIPQAVMRAAITPTGGEPIAWDKIAGAAASFRSPVREKAIDKLRERNAHLKEEATILTEVLQEMKTELEDLRWAVEAEKQLSLDPVAAALRRENAELEKTLRESREQARKMLQELRRLKEERKKPEER
jgi:RNA polymerase sigma factor (sigma-70 family)